MTKKEYNKPTIIITEMEPINMLAGTQTDHGDAKKRRDTYDDPWIEEDELEDDTGQEFGSENFFDLW